MIRDARKRHSCHIRPELSNGQQGCEALFLGDGVVHLVTIHLGREELYGLLLAVFIPLEQHCTDSDLGCIALDEKVPLDQNCASCASGLKKNFLFPVFFKDSLSGASNVATFFINRRYQTAVPRKALTSFMVLGSGIRLIAATRPGSIRKRPPPTMKPRHSATRRRYFMGVLMSGASISRSSK
ncbi:uncharacterized protein LOC121467241 [Drosophila elegans]|uniref:uncharacterized protein LOC121467241 n=1 Tax=Drosophila elegans TaxID=30023 RepID=UPI001BC83741|nr:uncharacterized protein LOC121467241 [Drosophila elegans]